MNDLQFQATRAVAEIDPYGPRGKIPTIAQLRDLDGKRHTLREYIDAVDWAMNRPPYALTRADKERAVAVMAQRLERSSRAFAREVDSSTTATAEGLRLDGACHRQRAALVRLAMARTVD